MSNLKKVTFGRIMKKVCGFTLVEFMIVAALTAVVASLAIPSMVRKAEDAQAARSVSETQQILIQAREHRLATGAWPATPAVLVAANRIPATAVNSVFGTPYVFSVVGGNNLQISINTGSVSKAIKLAGSDLPFAARSGTTVTTRVSPAGLEASNAQFYMLDGTRPLTGNMNAGGNSLNNVNQVNATGNITTTANMQGRRVTATDLMLSQNGFAALSNPAYVVRPDGASNIRNLTAEQIRGTYMESTGAIVAATTINAGGNITTAADFSGRSANLSQNLTAGGNINANGVITGGGIVSTGNIQGVNVNASNSISAPNITATTAIRAPRFESSTNGGYHLTPAGFSNLLDVNMRDVSMSYLHVTGNSFTGGNSTIAGSVSVTGAVNANGNIVSQGTIYSRNGFGSATNAAFIVIPDGTSTVNRINASVLQGGVVSATGDMTAQRFVDSNNTSRIVDPSDLTYLTDLTTSGRATLSNLTVQQIQTVGGSCVASSIALDSSGNVLSCKSGVWAMSAGGDFSKVIQGNITNGQVIPLPVGYSRNQCQITMAGATNAHWNKPNYFAGDYAEFDPVTRVARCGFAHDYNKYASGYCYYTVSCNKEQVITTTGPVSGESVSRTDNFYTGTSGTISPISGFSKNHCVLGSSSQPPGMTLNTTSLATHWNYSCSGSTGSQSPPSICYSTMTCTVP